MQKLLDFLNRLEENHIYYRLNKVRDAVLVEIAVPGARWEVEFLREGEIEVEKFVSDGALCDASALDVLFDAFQD